MDENEIKKIKDAADKIEIPDSLSPEEMAKKIDAWDNSGAGEGKHKKKSGVRSFGRAMAAVASVVLVLTIGVGYQALKNDNEDTSLSEEASDLTSDNAGITYDIPGVMHSAESYDEITDMIAEARKEWKKENSWWNQSWSGLVMTDGIEVAEESTEDAKTAGSADVSGDGYSDTNVRTDGVGEGDIVKTDGKYIYQYLSSGEIRIIKINNGKMKETATISLEEIGDAYLDEFILQDNRLYVVADIYEEPSLAENEDEDYVYVEDEENSSVFALTYDVSNPSKPSLIGQVKIDGSYRTSRFKDGYLYIMTTYGEKFYYYCGLEKNVETEDLIPKVNDKEILPGNILVPEEQKDEPFFVATSIDVSNPNEVVDTKAVMGYVDNLYVSKDAIYFYNEDYAQSEGRTVIVKFSYKDGKITPTTAGRVKGCIDDSFSIDEDDKGNLRVMTTLWTEEGTQESSLYVLNKNLKKIGSLLNIAENEGVKSCRFMGDIGYVVTFRNTDPLFAIDLSNPKNPVILSELKLPGFSEYLHAWGENYLLGIGYDADEENGSVESVKLTMFDISDPTDVKEVTTKLLDADSADIIDGDYKSLMIDPDKGIFGFFMSDWGDESDDWNTSSYYKVFRFDGDEFTEIFTSKDLEYNYYAENVRGLYAGDYFYLVENKSITSYNMDKNFEQVDCLK